MNINLKFAQMKVRVAGEVAHAYNIYQCVLRNCMILQI